MNSCVPLLALAWRLDGGCSNLHGQPVPSRWRRKTYGGTAERSRSVDEDGALIGHARRAISIFIQVAMNDIRIPRRLPHRQDVFPMADAAMLYLRGIW